MITSKKNLTMTQLCAIKAPVPGKHNMNESAKPVGNRYLPIKHSEVVLALINECAVEWIEATPDVLTVSNDKTLLAGTFVVEGEEVPVIQGYDVMVGLITSNARRKGTTFYAGLRNHRLGTGCVYRAYFVGRAVGAYSVKLSEVIQTMLADLPKLDAYVDTMESTLAQETEWKGMLLECAEKKVIPWSRLGDVFKTIQKNAVMRGTITALDLYEAFAQEVLRSPATTQLEQLSTLSKIVVTDSES